MGVGEMGGGVGELGPLTGSRAASWAEGSPESWPATWGKAAPCWRR